MFVRKSDINKILTGSFEERIDLFAGAASEKIGEPVKVISTRDDSGVVMTQGGRFMEVGYNIDDDGNLSCSDAKDAKIEAVQAEDVDKYVSDELHNLVEGAMQGKPIDCTQVQELARLVDEEEHYWLSDVLAEMDESLEESEWGQMYEVNSEKIRTAMYGSIRELESEVPKTRYAKIVDDKLPEFVAEMKESTALLGKIFNVVVDECQTMVFDKEDGEFFEAIRESLIAEAQTLDGLLSKAEKLKRDDDLARMAETHDRLAERAKVMKVVSGYLGTKAQTGGQG